MTSPPHHSPDASASDSSPQWESVASSDELAEGTGIERTVDDQLIALFRHQGAVYAIEGLCAHHGGPLSEGHVEDGCVTCPWHGWQYCLADGAHTASGAQLIKSYPAREIDGRIEVLVP